MGRNPYLVALGIIPVGMLTAALLAWVVGQSDPGWLPVAAWLVNLAPLFLIAWLLVAALRWRA